ncbi:hypothetical protein G7Y89_g7120 [Cudoniella acicularis]|uniref:C2H2-type domain-containing protein n=1 Tax=Cudoniella acicularis TaxID=354080 RepID=A0A8H4RLE9_9HELO|nr:hypothetical protein G7Y89_g7120 [Cudoniella acicularis]
MDPYLSTWLSTVEKELLVGEAANITFTPFPIWSLYTYCVSVLSKQQSNLADSGLPQEIVSNLKDESIKLKLWGDGYNGREIEGLLTQFLELKVTTTFTLLRIATLLTHRIFPFLGLYDSTPEQLKLIQDTQKLKSHSKLILVSMVPEVSHDVFVTPLDSEHHLPSSARILPRNCESQTQSKDKGISSPSSSSTNHEDKPEREFENILSELGIYTTALLDLLPSIAHSLAITTQTDIRDPNPFTMRILEKYGDDNRPLKEFLGDANMKRYDRLLRMTRNSPEITEAKDNMGIVPPSRIDSDFYSGTKSREVSSNMSRTGKSSSSFYSFYTSTSASTTAGKEDNREARIPPTPVEVKQGLPFTCEICWKLQKDIKNRADWELHVISDLEPYVCTYRECIANDTTFRTPKAWFEHEFNEHIMKHHWRCQQCPQVAVSRAEMKKHLEKTHNFSSLEQIMTNLERTQRPGPMPFNVMPCPLCLKVPRGGTRKSFISHVCRKLESIALEALPRRVQDDEETGSEFTRRARSNSQSSISHRSEISNHINVVSTEPSKSKPSIDDFTRYLDVGWDLISPDEKTQAATRGWKTYIENVYPITNVKIRLHSRRLSSYLIEANEGYLLFSEDLKQGKLVSTTLERLWESLKGPIPIFYDEVVLEASEAYLSPFPPSRPAEYTPPEDHEDSSYVSYNSGGPAILSPTSQLMTSDSSQKIIDEWSHETDKAHSQNSLLERWCEIYPQYDPSLEQKKSFMSLADMSMEEVEDWFWRRRARLPPPGTRQRGNLPPSIDYPVNPRATTLAKGEVSAVDGQVPLELMPLTSNEPGNSPGVILDGNALDTDRRDKVDEGEGEGDQTKLQSKSKREPASPSLRSLLTARLGNTAGTGPAGELLVTEERAKGKGKSKEYPSASTEGHQETPPSSPVADIGPNSEEHPEAHEISKKSELAPFAAGRAKVAVAASHYTPTPLVDQSLEPWIGAAVIKNPAGGQISNKLFYDTGSTDNMVTQKFVDTYKIPLRPVLPDDLKVFEFAGKYEFIPRHYIELELKGDEHEIREFTKVSFYVVTGIGPWTLLVGRDFMHKHGLGLSSLKRSAGALVLAERPASKSTKRQQALLVKEMEKVREEAERLEASTVTLATSATYTTSGQQPTSASRTSASRTSAPSESRATTSK